MKNKDSKKLFKILIYIMFSLFIAQIYGGIASMVDYNPFTISDKDWSSFKEHVLDYYNKWYFILIIFVFIINFILINVANTIANILSLLIILLSQSSQNYFNLCKTKKLCQTNFIPTLARVCNACH